MRTNVCKCNKKEKVQVWNKKEKKFSDESPRPRACVCVINSFFLVFIESWNLASRQSMSLLVWCLVERNDLIFSLSPYILPWPRPLAVIYRIILVDREGNDILCHQAPNSRNQRQKRDIIQTTILPDWKRFSCEICFVKNVVLEMVWPMKSSTIFSLCCCMCCDRVKNWWYVWFEFVLIWRRWICSSFNISRFRRSIKTMSCF